MPRWTDSQLTGSVIGGAIEIHRTLGPGLLEAVYEECLAGEFTLRDIPFRRQVPVPLTYKHIKTECGYRLDFVVAQRVVVEIKAIEALAPIHDAVMLTYLRLSGCPLGLLINFHVPILKDGIKRFVWHYQAPGTAKDNAEAQSAQRSAEEPKTRGFEP